MTTLNTEQVSTPAYQQSLTGLTEGDVLERGKQYGGNRLPTEKGTSARTILLAQFKSPLVYIILVAVGGSFLVGEIGDFGLIIAVVIIDVILGLIKELR